MTAAEMQALGLSLELAGITAILLLIPGLPLAWWLARSRARLRPAVEALVSLPLVLPPTVLGFYLLLAFSPDSPLGRLLDGLGLPPLAFSFPGLVLGSIIYSLPFMVQPLQTQFAALDPTVLDAAATLRAGPWDRFFHVVLPLARPGLITAVVMSFAHTLGEFGVVLMLGGNIPGRTRVASIAIYDQVENINYAAANRLSLVLLILAFSLLILIYAMRRNGVETVR